MDLIPSEPIQAQMGQTLSLAYPTNSHCQFLIEMYKSWNKMHDPLSDSAITGFKENIDEIPDEYNSFDSMMRN